MDPMITYTAAKARMDEFRAEADAERLVIQARRAEGESPCRAEAAGRRPVLAAPQIDCSWLERFWAFIRRALQVRTA